MAGEDFRVGNMLAKRKKKGKSASKNFPCGKAEKAGKSFCRFNVRRKRRRRKEGRKRKRDLWFFCDRPHIHHSPKVDAVAARRRERLEWKDSQAILVISLKCLLRKKLPHVLLQSLLERGKLNIRRVFFFPHIIILSAKDICSVIIISMVAPSILQSSRASQPAATAATVADVRLPSNPDPGPSSRQFWMREGKKNSRTYFLS